MHDRIFDEPDEVWKAEGRALLANAKGLDINEVTREMHASALADNAAKTSAHKRAVQTVNAAIALRQWLNNAVAQENRHLSVIPTLVGEAHKYLFREEISTQIVEAALRTIAHEDRWPELDPRTPSMTGSEALVSGGKDRK